MNVSFGRKYQAGLVCITYRSMGKSCVLQFFVKKKYWVFGRDMDATGQVAYYGLGPMFVMSVLL